ncbi:disulfide-isomerase erp38 [Trichoderma cornu-damae]|uniref:protein disulfide-isomerase n=1 Tax=Trichoderma cornu-damae TaxID=654480 RepID=A0A9P8QTG1_9HYPO|nr:disulfide-isomerase erp38 [Trichoderma cornu-damae]
MVLIKSLVLAALAGSVAAKSAVIDLIPANFDKLVFSGTPTLVEFFAPWCGHCKNLAPTYEELALSFEHAKDKVQIAKVDADSERELGKRFGIQGFPTLKFFDGKSKEPVEYKSGRDIDSLASFITEKTGVKPKKKGELPSNVAMLNNKSFYETIGGDKNVLVAFTAPWCGHCKNLAPTWEKVANDFASEETVVIAKVDAEGADSKDVAKEQGVTGYPTIKFFPAGSKEPVTYEGGRQEIDFINFINEKAGTYRTEGGDLSDAAGTVPSLDAIVTKFLGGISLSEAVSEIKDGVAKLKGTAEAKFSDYYVRVFDKLSQNDKFASKELTRLQSILAKGGLAAGKRDEIQLKVNVLNKFVPKEGKDEL